MMRFAQIMIFLLTVSVSASIPDFRMSGKLSLQTFQCLEPQRKDLPSIGRMSPDFPNDWEFIGKTDDA